MANYDFGITVQSAKDEALGISQDVKQTILSKCVKTIVGEIRHVFRAVGIEPNGWRPDAADTATVKDVKNDEVQRITIAAYMGISSLYRRRVTGKWETQAKEEWREYQRFLAGIRKSPSDWSLYSETTGLDTVITHVNDGEQDPDETERALDNMNDPFDPAEWSL